MNKVKDPRSIIVIALFLCLNVFIFYLSFLTPTPKMTPHLSTGIKSAMKSQVYQFDYYHTKKNLPLLFLSAQKMKSISKNQVEFENPFGNYFLQNKSKKYHYEGKYGRYDKLRSYLILKDGAQIKNKDSTYAADFLIYKSLLDEVSGKGHIIFDGVMPKNKDKIHLTADEMIAWPQKKISDFQGHINGTLLRRNKAEGMIKFKSDQLKFNQNISKITLLGNVKLEKPAYQVSARKGEIFLDNFNKSLKYFVLNDDVKVTEEIKSEKGDVQVRKAFAERLEGFGQEEKMVLSGAPRVETQNDIIKGYQITIRENVELIEVDDAMSDVQVKKN